MEVDEGLAVGAELDVVDAADRGAADGDGVALDELGRILKTRGHLVLVRAAEQDPAGDAEHDDEGGERADPLQAPRAPAAPGSVFPLLLVDGVGRLAAGVPHLGEHALVLFRVRRGGVGTAHRRRLTLPLELGQAAIALAAPLEQLLPVPAALLLLGPPAGPLVGVGHIHYLPGLQVPVK